MKTKSEINKVLQTGNRTQIFKLAKLCGVNVKSKSDVYDFIKNNASTKRIKDLAFSIACYAPNYKEFQYGRYPEPHREPIANAVRFAREQKKRGRNNYSKILVVANTSIYWCSPDYGLADYNKSIAFPNNEKYREVAKKINRFLNFNATYEN